MPYAKPSGAPDYVAKEDRPQWIAVWNSTYQAAKAKGMADDKAESRAFRYASGVVKKMITDDVVRAMAKYSPDQAREEHGKFSDGGQTPKAHTAALKQSGYKFHHVQDSLGGKQDVWRHPESGNTVHVMRSGRAMTQGPKIASGAVSTDLEGLKVNL